MSKFCSAAALLLELADGMLRAARRFVREVREATSQRTYDVRGEKVLWDFRQADCLREWSCISDKDIGGYSSVSLEPNGKGQCELSGGI